MSETAKALRPLVREMPALPTGPRVDEDGDTIRFGFGGDFSQEPRFVTDGHMLLLVAGIDASVVIEQTDEPVLRKYATSAAVEKVWKAAEERSYVGAVFIGWHEAFCRHLAFVRDAYGRIMVVDAHKLAFANRAVRPDALTVGCAPFARFFESPLALWREGALVGLLMPMKFEACDLKGLDLSGEPVSLQKGHAA